MYVVNHSPSGHAVGAADTGFVAVDSRRDIHGFQVWVVTLAAGDRLPRRRHAGEYALLALSGSGKLRVDGGPQRFAAPCTLVIPPGVDFEIVNDIALPMQLVAVYTVAPVDAA